MPIKSNIFCLTDGPSPVIGCTMAVLQENLVVEAKYNPVTKNFGSRVSVDPRKTVNWIKKIPRVIKTWRNPKIHGVLEKCNNNKEVISEGL